MSSPIYDHHHAVQFYGEEKTLFESVAAFLGQGFLDGQPAIVIATAKHRAGILNHLEQRMIDVTRAQRLGDLVLLDAEQALDSFMEGDGPSPTRFEKTVGPMLARMSEIRARGTCVRAYGEMVDVLWQQGRSDAAIALESLWNRLANRHGFALLCGYAMRNFRNDTNLFEEVCRQHTHVMPARLAH
jgi:KaiC/GvpD/RAD55 family RecA-like ATPase